MSQFAAPEEKLGELHAIIADTLIEQLSNFDPEEGLDPRVLSSAISFLRDNKIKANPFLDEKMSEIEQRLKDRTRRFKVVPGEAAKRAANE
jgi:hypothetical protein